MATDPVAVLGTGMAAFGAAHALRSQRKKLVCFDQHSSYGGHTRSNRYREGFVFDEGPHISFTTNKRVRTVFAESVKGAQREKTLTIDNYWHGRRIPHPVHCHLHGLPPELVIKIVEDFVATTSHPSGDIDTSARPHEKAEDDLNPRRTYAEWLRTAYGKAFADTFPVVYGQKYHTTSMDQLTTEWIGPRMYKPRLDEVLRGALQPVPAAVHYIQTYRYPESGGFLSYLKPFEAEFDVRLNHRLVGLNPRSRLLHFAHGAVHKYSAVISTIPLPDLIPLINNVPQSVLDAARKLAFTSVALINVGIARSDLSETAITYFYDEDILMSRISLPHMFSHNNAPPGCGSIQAEVYFSEKYKPLHIERPPLIETTMRDLRRCGFVHEDDVILMRDVQIIRYANVIYDLARADALATVHNFLKDVGIYYCGRYGNWDHSWTDQSFLSGEEAATRVLNEM